VGKLTLALNLAQALNCEAQDPPCGECQACRRIGTGKHADVQVIGLANDQNLAGRLRTEISIDQIRELQHAVSLPPYEGKKKVFIIDGAEYLNSEAANCLLKTLEEPPPYVLLILLAVNDRVLLPTIVSRCQRIELGSLSGDVAERALLERGGIAPEKARVLARICGGGIGWAFSACADDSLLQARSERVAELLHLITANLEERFDYAAQLAAQFGRNRKAVMEVLDLWLSLWHDLLFVRAGCADLVTNIDCQERIFQQAQGYSLKQIVNFMGSLRTARWQLEQNANARLALEVLMLDIPNMKRIKEVSREVVGA
jgi:DNA polymerase-3 subunit delta'